MEKKSPSPKRKGGKAKKKEEAPTPMPAGPLPIVKAKDYEEFLQGHLNAHPTISRGKLLKALEDYARKVQREGYADVARAPRAYHSGARYC